MKHPLTVGPVTAIVAALATGVAMAQGGTVRPECTATSGVRKPASCGKPAVKARSAKERKPAAAPARKAEPVAGPEQPGVAVFSTARGAGGTVPPPTPPTPPAPVMTGNTATSGTSAMNGTPAAPLPGASAAGTTTFRIETGAPATAASAASVPSAPSSATR